MATKLSKYGLDNIYTAKTPSIENIEEIYNSTKNKFESNKQLINQLIDYYKGKQEEGIPDTSQSINEKIVKSRQKKGFIGEMI